MVQPHLTVQPHLHCADLSGVLVNAEELGAALAQDGEPECRIVCLWVVGICGLGPGYEGSWEGQGELRSATMGQVWSGTCWYSVRRVRSCLRHWG